MMEVILAYIHGNQHYLKDFNFFQTSLLYGKLMDFNFSSFKIYFEHTICVTMTHIKKGDKQKTA